MLKEEFNRMINETEEDIFDGFNPGDIPTQVMDAYMESLNREKGISWEETV